MHERIFDQISYRETHCVKIGTHPCGSNFADHSPSEQPRVAFEFADRELDDLRQIDPFIGQRLGTLGAGQRKQAFGKPGETG